MRFCRCELGSTERGSAGIGTRFIGESTAIAMWSMDEILLFECCRGQDTWIYATDNIYLPLLLTSLRGRRCRATPSSWSVRGAVVRQDSGSAAGMIPAEKNSCCSSLSTEGRRAGFDCSCSTIIEAAGFRSDDGILCTSYMYDLETLEFRILETHCACFYFKSTKLLCVLFLDYLFSVRLY